MFNPSQELQTKAILSGAHAHTHTKSIILINNLFLSENDI